MLFVPEIRNSVDEETLVEDKGHGVVKSGGVVMRFGQPAAKAGPNQNLSAAKVRYHAAGGSFNTAWDYLIRTHPSLPMNSQPSQTATPTLSVRYLSARRDNDTLWYLFLDRSTLNPNQK